MDVQAAIPLGIHDDSPVSISLVAPHGTDKFLLDTVLDMYSSLQQEVSNISSSSLLPDTNSNMDTAELLKEKVHLSTYILDSQEFLKIVLVIFFGDVVLFCYNMHITQMLFVWMSYLS